MLTINSIGKDIKILSIIKRIFKKGNLEFELKFQGVSKYLIIFNF